MNEPITISVPIDELREMQRLVDEAIEPQVRFSVDMEKMKKEADHIIGMRLFRLQQLIDKKIGRP